MYLIKLSVGVVRLVEGENGLTARFGETLAQILIISGLLGGAHIVWLLAVRLLGGLVLSWRLADRVHLVGRRVHYRRLARIAQLCGLREATRERAEVPPVQNRNQVSWHERP